jgi:hypothetical protein
MPLAVAACAPAQTSQAAGRARTFFVPCRLFDAFALRVEGADPGAVMAVIERHDGA